MARIGFHRLDSEFARRTIDSIRERLQRGETVYVLGFAASGTHNTGVALVEITQAGGPRIVVNNEEERFSGEKHTTEYPRRSIDAMVEQLRAIGRDVGDIAAIVTTWDYPLLFATLARTVLEEAPAQPEIAGERADAGRRPPPPGSDAADAAAARQTVRPHRTFADDLHAASRQPRLVFVCRLAIRR